MTNPNTIKAGERTQGMTQDKWDTLSQYEREQIRDNSDLSTQLIGCEGYRVEVITDYDETRRFIVGKSTGWKPIHLEVANRLSSGGSGAEKHYKSVKTLYKVF